VEGRLALAVLGHVHGGRTRQETTLVQARLGSCGRENAGPGSHRGHRRPDASRTAPPLLAKMPHELHTPLTSILLYVRLPADNPDRRLSDEEVGFAAGIRAAGSALLQRIDDILDPAGDFP